jgi:hypothetical protein
MLYFLILDAGVWLASDAATGHAHVGQH